MVIFDELFQIAGIDHAVDVNSLQSVYHLFNECRIAHIPQITDCHFRLCPSTDLNGFDEQIHGRKPVSQEGKIHAKAFDKAFPGTADHLLRFGLTNSTVLDFAGTRNDCSIESVDDNHDLTGQNLLDQGANLMLGRYVPSDQDVICDHGEQFIFINNSVFILRTVFLEERTQDVFFHFPLIRKVLQVE